MNEHRFNEEKRSLASNTCAHCPQLCHFTNVDNIYISPFNGFSQLMNT